MSRVLDRTARSTADTDETQDAVIDLSGTPEELSAESLANRNETSETTASSDEDTPRQGGFFTRFLRADSSATTPTDAESPIEEEPGDDGVDTAQDTEPNAIDPTASEAPSRGFFAGLFGGSRGQETTDTSPPSDDQAQSNETAQAEQSNNDEAVPETARRGFFSRLTRSRAEANEDVADTAVTASASAPQATLLQGGVLGLIAPRQPRPHKGPDAEIVEFGSVLASGAVARVCEFPKRRLGKEVARYPEQSPIYKIFDSAPRSEDPRPFYVTGFEDGCARTFTASLALFGPPSMHEQLRYGLPSKVQPYSTTDKAYEGIKRAVCGVGRRKACGDKIGLLEVNTVFVSIYDHVGSNSTWSNLLLHRGWVLAADQKS